jgi:hypothetical protein
MPLVTKLHGVISGKIGACWSWQRLRKCDAIEEMILLTITQRSIKTGLARGKRGLPSDSHCISLWNNTADWQLISQIRISSLVMSQSDLTFPLFATSFRITEGHKTGFRGEFHLWNTFQSSEPRERVVGTFAISTLVPASESANPLWTGCRPRKNTALQEDNDSSEAQFPYCPHHYSESVLFKRGLVRSGQANDSLITHMADASSDNHRIDSHTNTGTVMLSAAQPLNAEFRPIRNRSDEKRMTMAKWLRMVWLTWHRNCTNGAKMRRASPGGQRHLLDAQSSRSASEQVNESSSVFATTAMQIHAITPALALNGMMVPVIHK